MIGMIGEPALIMTHTFQVGRAKVSLHWAEGAGFRSAGTTAVVAAQGAEVMAD